MKLTVTLPGWQWLLRLVERLHPGFNWRAQKFGRTTETASFLGGALKITTSAQVDP